MSTRVQYTTNHQALAVICGESCSCSSCLSTSEIVGPRSCELANFGTRPRGWGWGSQYREAETRQRPRTQTVLWREPYPMDRAIIMICDMPMRYGPRECECDLRRRYGPRECAMGRANAIHGYAMGRANVICDMRIRYGPRECDMRYANTLWAARMRYANSLACQTCQRGRKVWEPASSVLVRGIWNYFASRKRNADFMSSC